MPMRPMMEDHNFRELLRMERDVTRKLFRVDQAMRAVAGEDFRRPQVEQRLAQALEKYYGAAVRLEIAVSDGVEVTPDRLQAQAADDRQKAAEQSIDADANVRAMRETFGATVVPGSVKPLN